MLCSGNMLKMLYMCFADTVAKGTFGAALYKDKLVAVPFQSLYSFIPIGGTPYSLHYLVTQDYTSQHIVFYYQIIQPIIFCTS